jgi:selenide, water dikinase
MDSTELPKLTQFSPGAGCGCKISPKDLQTILETDIRFIPNKNLLVGYETKDDAAVYDLGNGTALISTTDFFTPIVDDPFDFGRIAATNAISDVYAMGGTPVLAISILGWPLEKLPHSIARKVIEGPREVCNNAGITLAGGHSINISDPVFGLSVNGIIPVDRIKQNRTATNGCRLFITKPLGIGIVTTAEKKGILEDRHRTIALDLMTTLNKAGTTFGKFAGVKAMTDVTGFGLLGHLLELCEGSRLSARIHIDQIPVIEGIQTYIDQKAIPGGTFRNWNSYGEKIGPISENQKMVLCDPQTSGGLLVAVSKDETADFISISNQIHQEIWEIGVLTNEKKQRIEIMS